MAWCLVKHMDNFTLFYFTLLHYLQDEVLKKHHKLKQLYIYVTWVVVAKSI
jgi:hypothetical protein